MICIEKKCDINDEWERFITSSNHENGPKLSNYELFNNTTKKMNPSNTINISNKPDKVTQPKKISIKINDNKSSCKENKKGNNILDDFLDEDIDVDEVIIEEDQQQYQDQDQPIVDFDNVPQSTPIYISTKTNIAYLNSPVDIRNVFWEIPTIPYSLASEGIIKKQIKLNSLNMDELNEIKDIEKLAKDTFNRGFTVLKYGDKPKIDKLKIDEPKIEDQKIFIQQEIIIPAVDNSIPQPTNESITKKVEISDVKRNDKLYYE